MDKNLIKNEIKNIVSDIRYQGLTKTSLFDELTNRGIVIDDELLFTQIIKELEEEFILFLNGNNRYLNDRLANKYTGTISIRNNEYGFITNNYYPDIYVSQIDSMNAMDKDIVLYAIMYNFDRQPYARVIKILKRHYEYLVGEIIYYNGKTYLRTMEKHLTKDIFVSGMGNAKVGDICRTKIKTYGYALKVDVLDVLGRNTELGMDITQIAASTGVLRYFSDDVIKEVNNFDNDALNDEILHKRKTYPNNLIFTIDGDDAKDLDDAVSIKKKANGNYELGVYIADVSYYVKENTLCDQEALTRGTSVYLVDRVIPMLPVRLSNDLCSLNPGENKLVISCIMEVNDKGEVVESRIEEGIIKTTKRLSYSKCNDCIDNGLKNNPDYDVAIDSLKLMHELSLILTKKRQKRGSIDFDVDEPLIITDEKGIAIDIVKRKRGISERIIEEFMILANETVAEFITQFDLPFIYRVHDKPEKQKFFMLKEMVSKLGYRIKSIHPMELQKLLDDLSETDSYLKNSVLRLMTKAVYSNDNIGHFGLASKCYTHFTSPIRRYPDLLVHRLLRYYIFEEHNNLSDIETDELYNKIGIIALKNSESERQAVDCEFKVIDMKKAEYMTKYIGSRFEGVVTSIHKFGIFVTLNNTVDGLISSARLKDKHFFYVQEKNYYERQFGVYTLSLGDKVNIKVVDSDKKTGEIDFDLVYNISGEIKYGKNKNHRKK